LTATAEALAELDVLAGWAVLAREWDYCRPDLDEDEVLTIPSSTQPGIYYILFIADFDEQFPEINETNNITYQSFTVTSVAVSDDFYVGDISISKSSAVAGEIIDASCIQLYSGIKLKSQLNSSKLGYYLSNNTTFEPSVDILLATDESDLGSDNLTSVEDASFAIPHGTSIGTYYILFVADYNNQFAEGNELNNVRYKQLSVVVDMSNEDFFLQEAVVNPTMLVAGRTLEVSINQHYAGAKRNAEMGSVTVGYFLSNNPGYDIGIDIMLGSDGSDLGSDVPFNEESATLTIPIGTPAGTYYILFVADFDNKFSETNEGNNLVSKSIFVSDGSNDNDLTISNPTIFPTTVASGRTIEANNLQCYTGSKLSFEIPDVVQGYYLSTNMSFEPAIDIQLGTNISNLGSELNCEEENAILTIPLGVEPGNYHILFVTDHNGAISEVDETNNVSPVGVTVSSNTFTVTLVSNPISGGSTLGTGTYHVGEICTLSASPYYGFSFSHWSENGNIISTEPNYSFSVTSNKYLTAVFVQSQGTYVIETSAYPEGNGFTSGDGAYRNGEMCTVTATPAECYVFVQWLQDGYPISNNPTYQFVVRENSNLIAHFEKNIDRYLVNTTLEPTIGGRIVSGSTSYRCGETCTLTTEPYGEYYFMYWTENDSVVSLDSHVLLL